MKKLLVIAAGILAIALVLSFVKDMAIKASVEKVVELVTGLPLKMRSLNVGIIRTIVEIKNLRLFNPKGYPEKVMFNIPEIYVDYSLPSIIKGKVHLEEMRIDLREFVVVNNVKNELNLNSLKVIQAQEEGTKLGTKTKGKMPEVAIDNLELKTVEKPLF